MAALPWYISLWQHILNSGHASEKCQTIDGFELVSIHSKQNQDDIHGALLNLDSTTNRYLIGMREQSGSDGGYYWLDGSPLDFTFWGVGQPNDLNGAQQCVIMNQKMGFWEDVNCGFDEGYICAPRKATPPPVVNEKHCDEGWMEYEDNCFQFSDKNDMRNWTSANAECKVRGGFLASIHSSYQDAFLYAQTVHVTGDAWLGFHDQDVFDRWVEFLNIKLSHGLSNNSRLMPRENRGVLG